MTPPTPKAPPEHSSWPDSAALVRITPERPWPLVGLTGTREWETSALATHPAPPLMERAGAATARLAMALAPHSRRIWIACGPGNNGGDGAVAARLLHQAGLSVHVSALPRDPLRAPPADAATAWARLAQAGVAVHEQAPDSWDLAIDALLGIGSRPGPSGQLANWLVQMNQADAPVLCLDTPSALDSQSGHWSGAPQRGRGPRHTLSLLTLKPGLFTLEGRDWAGQVWWDTLSLTQPDHLVCAELQGRPTERQEAHARHKGHYGDLAVVGGDAGMEGAAWLAGSAALHAGAGRVWVSLLSRTVRASPDMSVVATSPPQPLALMTRDHETLDLEQTHVVCGCGGGQAVRRALPRLISGARSLVLDADALNALSQDSMLHTLLAHRGRTGKPTVLTPHPLEAARLLGLSTPEVQANRLNRAQELANRFGAVVVLKGSGSIIAAPHERPRINPTGNARLATAGTGDVLAGQIGARLAQGESAWQAATHAVYWHGHTADQWPGDETLIADRLAQFSRGRQTASGSP